MPALLRYTDIGPELQPRSVNAIYCTWECPLYHLAEAVLSALPRGLRGAARPGLVRLVLSPSVQLIFSKKPGV